MLSHLGKWNNISLTWIVGLFGDDFPIFKPWFHSYEGILTVDVRQKVIVNLDRWQIEGSDPMKNPIENPIEKYHSTLHVVRWVPHIFPKKSHHQILKLNLSPAFTGHFRNLNWLEVPIPFFEAYIIFQALISGNIPRIHMDPEIWYVYVPPFFWIPFKSSIEVIWKIIIFN